MDSLQMHVIKLYTSKRRQCRMGYENSAQCDSFQVGEAIKFFSRIGTIQLLGLVPGPSGSEPSTRSITETIKALRQCPSYQIDRNHAHCGVRAKLMPHLHTIEDFFLYGGGLCRLCWKDGSTQVRWSDPADPTPGRSPSGNHARICETPLLADRIKAFFTASPLEWV